MKKTLAPKIKTLRVKKMSGFISGLMGVIVNILYKRPCNVTIDYLKDIKKYKNKPVIVVANHASRFDYAFMRMALKRPMNIIAAESGRISRGSTTASTDSNDSSRLYASKDLLFAEC